MFKCAVEPLARRGRSSPDPVELTIGKRSGSTINYFAGTIDDARVYDRALAVVEITALVLGDDGSPIVAIRDVAPDPRFASVDQVFIDFSEAVINFDVNDLSLTRDGAKIPLTGIATLATSDNSRRALGGWTLSPISRASTN